MLLRTAKSCGPDASTPASSLRRHVGPTGGRQASIRKRRGETSPVTGESTKETVKTTACGNAGCSGATVVTTLVCYLHFAHEAAGAAGTRPSPRPLFFKGASFMHKAGGTRRGSANSYAHAARVPTVDREGRAIGSALFSLCREGRAGEGG